MKNHKLLLIDDDKELAELLTDYLATEGFELICCHDGISGLEKAFDDKISLILLDVMMPGLTGFEVLKALGGNHKSPILMLTAKGDNADRILGLELGADDYLPKPFQHRELLARIKAILRRIDIVKNTKDPISALQVNGVKLNHATRQVTCHDQFVELTGTEYQIIEHLMAKPGSIVSKTEISEQSSSEHADLDLCSPFCQCHCCHIHTTYFNILDFAIASTPISTQVFFHFNGLEKDFNNTILQPPQV